MSNGLETRFPNLYLAILTQISRQTWELWLLPQAKLRGVPPDAIEAAGVHPTSLVTLAEMLKETMVFTSQISMKAGTSPPPLFRTALHKNWKMQLFQKGADSPDSIHKQNSEQMYTLKKYLDSSFQEFHRNPEFHLKSALKIAIKNQNWTHQFLLFFGPFGWTNIPSPHISSCSWRLRKSIPRRAAHATGRIARNDDKWSVKNCEWDVLKPLSGFN